MRARVHVTLKAGVLDPQGRAIARALEALGFGGVAGVRQGKYIEIDLEDGPGNGAAAAARDRVAAMCETLLANPVIEDYRVEIDS